MFKHKKALYSVYTFLLQPNAAKLPIDALAKLPTDALKKTAADVLTSV